MARALTELDCGPWIPWIPAKCAEASVGWLAARFGFVAEREKFSLLVVVCQRGEPASGKRARTPCFFLTLFALV